MFRVKKAQTRKWVPQPMLNGRIDWRYLSDILELLYKNPRHGNPDDPLDDLIYVMLTRKSPIDMAPKIFKKLKEKYENWDNLLQDSQNNLINLLYGIGLEEIRAKDITDTLEIIKKEFGSLSLDPLKKWTNDRCLRLLTSLPGVGTKTARCVMMYALGRNVFPADAHCTRLTRDIFPVYPIAKTFPIKQGSDKSFRFCIAGADSAQIIASFISVHFIHTDSSVLPSLL